MEPKVSVSVNGKGIRLNAFVQKAFAGAIEGLVASLSDLPAKIDTIEVAIVKNPEEAEG